MFCRDTYLACDPVICTNIDISPNLLLHYELLLRVEIGYESSSKVIYQLH